MDLDVERDLATENEVDFDENKVVISLKGPIPLVNFLDQLEQWLAQRWKKVVIARLLGNKIGYQGSKLYGALKTLRFLTLVMIIF